MLASSKTVTCKISHLTSNTGKECPSDLDEDFHYGFTVGKGKTMYWMITWCRSGHCYIYKLEGQELVRRYLKGDTLITIHFK